MKMGLVLVRDTYNDDSTIGKLHLDGNFICDTLEDRCRNIKIKDKTAIPSGTYEVIIRYSNRFERELPALLEVPYFDGILIHPGNTSHDSSGCILVGDRDKHNPNFVGNSRNTFAVIFPMIQESLKKDRLFINIYGGFNREDFETAKRLGIKPND